MNERVFVVAALVAMFVIGRLLYTRYRAAVESHRPDHPQLPDRLRHPSALRTWVVFTTPYCASCEPVKTKLAGADPDAHVVTIDATREPRLADDFAVRSAPTVLLADETGQITERLVGAAAVERYFATA